MILDTKRLFFTVLLFFGLYAFLTWFIPTIGLDKTYYNTFIKMNQSFYGDYGDRGEVTFMEAKSNTSSYQQHPFKKYDDDVLIKILNKQQKAAAVRDAKSKGLSTVNIGHAEFYVNTWQYAMIPMIFLMALILATPFDWKSGKEWLKKLFSLGAGLLLFNIFIIVRFWVRFVTEVNRHGWLEVGNLGSTSKWLFTHFNTFLMFMGVTLSVAIFIWAVVTFPFIDKNKFITNAR